jgi:hypothetical protein
MKQDLDETDRIRQDSHGRGEETDICLGTWEGDEYENKNASVQGRTLIAQTIITTMDRNVSPMSRMHAGKRSRCGQCGSRIRGQSAPAT